MLTANLNFARLLEAELSNQFDCDIVEDDGKNALIKESYGKFIINKTAENTNKFYVSFGNDVDDNYKEEVMSFLTNSVTVKNCKLIIERK